MMKEGEIKEEDNISSPDWAFDAALDESKPEWQDFIPEELYELGEVFFPIPPGKKGWRYPHHQDENRFSADSEVLNGYFAQGWNYGIACAEDLIVIDVDEKEYLQEITEDMPPSLWQKTGSRSGVHIFYFCEGLDTRQTLRVWVCHNCESEFTEWEKEEDDDETERHYCPECGEERSYLRSKKRHLGEIKADPHGYVVGPPSLHPSGNRYGPLCGDEIQRVEKLDMLEWVDEFTIDDDSYNPNFHPEREPDIKEYDDSQPLYALNASDVLPYLEENNRIAHPVHGSDTGSNFMLNEGGETFMCWRCQIGGSDGCGLSAQQFLASEELGYRGQAGEYVCEDVRRRWSKDSRLHYYAWKQAIMQDLIPENPIPYRVIEGYAVENGMVEENDTLTVEQRATSINGLLYESSYDFSTGLD